MSDADFKLNVPVSFFYKADAPEGQQRRIGGLVSTECKDREGETIIQRGLNFKEFEDMGYFNDNHSKSTDSILGFPDRSVKFIKKGEKLPDGSIAPNHGHWAEGVLLQGYAPADRIWELGQAMTKAGSKRRLGFSIEGSILQRSGPDNKVISRANVRNVAITGMPVNQETTLIPLAKAFLAEDEVSEAYLAFEKALMDAEKPEDMDLDTSPNEEKEKALTMGPVSSNAAPTSGGRVLARQSLEGDEVHQPKRFNKSEAASWVRERYPDISKTTAERVVEITASLQRRGLI